LRTDRNKLFPVVSPEPASCEIDPLAIQPEKTLIGIRLAPEDIGIVAVWVGDDQTALPSLQSAVCSWQFAVYRYLSYSKPYRLLNGKYISHIPSD